MKKIIENVATWIIAIVVLSAICSIVSKNEKNDVKITNKNEVYSKNNNDNEEEQKNIDYTLEMEKYEPTEEEYLRLYVKQYNIKMEEFFQMDKINERKLELLDEMKDENYSPMYIKMDEKYSGLTETLSYSEVNRTKNETNFIYLGEIKDNKPDGIGMIIEKVSFFDTKYDFIRYLGYFKEGYFNGVGKLYASTNQEDLNEYYKIDNTMNADGVVKAFNYLIYEGEFKKGNLTGKGNRFHYVDYIMQNDIKYSIDNTEVTSENEESLDTSKNLLKYPIYKIETGEFKNSKIDGDGKTYTQAVLTYKGEYKKGKFDGKGELFFPSGKIKYKGEFTSGEYDGNGTEYDENGNEIYSGKWYMGDYDS